MEKVVNSHMAKEIKWGIIGCGDVAEIKSGPAFQITPNSSLVSVMRRDLDKAKDFALRHGVPNWSNNANDLLNNTEINAIYIATPPSTHLDYTLMAISAGKHVYLEKPMAMTTKEAGTILQCLENSNSKLTVAHYRRKVPAFVKIKELLDQHSIGTIRYVDLQILQPRKSGLIAESEENWRLNPAISGGGYFYDIAPHQIDLMYHYFGAIAHCNGHSFPTGQRSKVQDIVNGIIAFKNGIQFHGVWNFIASDLYRKEECIIYGDKGKITFSFYGDTITLTTELGSEIFEFTNPKHIQQPMIEATVNYFLGKVENPCPAEDGLLVMDTMECLCHS
ncbi:Gfo/Idh/MocA family protein [Maribacter sp. CXY002]|uniref:Gfo/Idh/MocA family protein n=1 Tax=Maribacter luteocoastalis TaxID=3407671 RepID=UPI003B67E274